ncbi:MAG: ADP-ribosylglycohydrolase family protein [Paludibacteraceae bacterium]|nr:ADP-ribosylglycohydrolase family protein [Paludibacteraceae bacterium]
METNIQDRIRGSLIGGAIGDALGYTVEFWGRKQILSHYGEQGITEFELSSNGKALVSDDTQMTLFTANGLLNWLNNNLRLSGAPITNFVENAYLDWYYTQTGKTNSADNGEERHYTWLHHLPELASRRAPGTTCMNACEALLAGQQPVNSSKGCGGIMRVAPVGMMQASYVSAKGKKILSDLHLAEETAKIARITHLHPLGYLPAALLALLIVRVSLLAPEEVRSSITDIVQDVLEIVMQYENNDELRQITERAIQLANANIPDSDAIGILGEGWTGEEAWAIALYCVVRHIDSAKDAIIAAVNHDGDSDSTGSIVGNIMGAIYGYKALKGERLFCPNGRELQDTLELSNIILALADDLALYPHVSEYSTTLTRDQANRWYQRYGLMSPFGV